MQQNEKPTTQLSLENGDTITVYQTVADRWQTQPPKNYLFNYGGKVALMQIAEINRTLHANNKDLILSFGDFVKSYVELFNQVYNTQVVFNGDIVNASKSSYNFSKVKKMFSAAATASDDTVNKLQVALQDFMFAQNIEKPQMAEALKQAGIPQNKIEMVIPSLKKDKPKKDLTTMEQLLEAFKNL